MMLEAMEGKKAELVICDGAPEGENIGEAPP
jgi:hypothetical protein